LEVRVLHFLVLFSRKMAGVTELVFPSLDQLILPLSLHVPQHHNLSKVCAMFVTARRLHCSIFLSLSSVNLDLTYIIHLCTVGKDLFEQAAV
jgi:hypothetical protein